MSNRERPIGQGFDIGDMPEGQPDLASARVNTVMVERLLRAFIRYELDYLVQPENRETLRRLMSTQFDPIVGTKEREEFIVNLVRNPPLVELGYWRPGVELPLISVVIAEEAETQLFLDGFLGETLEDEQGQAADYSGSIWSVTCLVEVWAQHVDVVSYLYHLVKAILVGGRKVLMQFGFQTPEFGGQDLRPAPEFLPELIYVRGIRATGQAVMAVPNYKRDPARFRTTIYREDVVVDGVRGGVVGTTEGE